MTRRRRRGRGSEGAVREGRGEKVLRNSRVSSGCGSHVCFCRSKARLVFVVGAEFGG